MTRHHTPTPSYGYLLVLLAFTIMVIQWGVFFSFGVYFKPMIAEFGWTRAMTSGGFSLASLVGGFVTAYLGWLNDRVGPRTVMTLCGLSLGLGCMLLSRTGSLWHFYVFYGVIIGFALGGGFIPLMSTVARWFTYNRGLASGIVASGVGVGALVGPQISNKLLMAFGWRGAYFMTGITALVIVVATAQFLKTTVPQIRSTESSRRQTDLKAEVIIHPGVSLGAALGSSQFWLFSLTGFLLWVYIVFTDGARSAPCHRYWHRARAGRGFAVNLRGIEYRGKILFGKILDKINGKNTMIIGFCMMAIAFWGLAYAGRTWAIFLSVGVFGFFYGACTVAHSPLTAVLFGLKSHGLIMGVFGLSVTMGGALGPLLTGAIFDRTHSYAAAFGICIGISTLGLAATAAIKHRCIQ